VWSAMRGGRLRGSLRWNVDSKLDRCTSISEILLSIVASIHPNGLVYGCRDLHGVLCSSYLSPLTLNPDSSASGSGSGDRLDRCTIGHNEVNEERGLSLRGVNQRHTSFHLYDLIWKRMPVRMILKNYGLPEKLVGKIYELGTNGES